jgi:hypothetical protein
LALSGIDRIRVREGLVAENVIVLDTAEFEQRVGRPLAPGLALVTRETGAGDSDVVVASVRGWNARKRSQMKEGHVLAAFARLREHKWVVPAP